ncbi:hypothetical protein GUJ93_ZPchr0010g9986 [Zizania palustris]|uniref:Uncharacterized protein n=1 Tax=Zizania palustris TaxID=103762 RepID=A0A8J5WHA1_ZIZPA|nr:hypothetical protein GUJ93_ZPchr0010g9986 [Zizania palustris]
MAGRKQKRDTSGRFCARILIDCSNGNSSASGDNTSSDTEMCPIVLGHRFEPSRIQVMIIIESSEDSGDGDDRRRYQAPASGSGTKRQQADLSHVLNEKIDALIDKLFRK